MASDIPSIDLLTVGTTLVGTAIDTAQTRHTAQAPLREAARTDSAQIRFTPSLLREILRTDTAQARYTAQAVQRQIVRTDRADVRHTPSLLRDISRTDSAQVRYTAAMLRDITRIDTAQVRYTAQAVQRNIVRTDQADVRYTPTAEGVQRRADFDGFAKDVELLKFLIGRWVDEEHAAPILQIITRILQTIQNSP